MGHSGLDRFTRTEVQNWISLVFLGKKRPEFRRKRDSHEPLLIAMARALPLLNLDSSRRADTKNSSLPLEQKSLHTQLFIVGELISQLHTHISYTTSIVEKLLCVIRVYLWCLLVFPLWYRRKAITRQECSGNQYPITHTAVTHQYPVVQMALQTEKNIFELTTHFVADTDTDKIYFEINFSLQIQIQLFFAVLRGHIADRNNIGNKFLFHSRYRYREILFSNYFRYEFGQTVTVGELFV